MDAKITYHQQVTYCGKPRCRKCRDGVGHGPYWYAYQTIDGQTTRTYIGKNLPTGAMVKTSALPESTGHDASTARSLDNSRSSSSTAPAPLLRILTLGQFRLERLTSSATTEAHTSLSWQAVTEAGWQQRQDSQIYALLGYLICSPERHASRSQTLALLWPDLDSETATRRLTKTLQALQRVLGHPLVENTSNDSAASRSNSHLLQIQNEELLLAGQERLFIDATAFEELIQKANEQTLPIEQRERLLQEAITLYNGDFLPEERDAEWILARRRTLRYAWFTALLSLADLYTERNNLSDAVKILDRLLAKDPTYEAAVQRLMVVLSRSMRRIEALRAYKHFESMLKREYQAIPSKETQELHEALRQGQELPSLQHNSQRGQSAVADLAPSTHSDMNVSASYSTTDTPQSISLPVRDTPADIFGRTHQSPLVGREHEMEVLLSKLLEVEQNARLHLVSQRKASGIPFDTQRRSQCQLLMGEAGIGKTRLAEEMSREARQRGWIVIWSHLYPQERNIPYRVWIEALRKILGLGTGLLPALDPELLRPLLPLLPELGELLPRPLLDQPLAPAPNNTRLRDAIGVLLKTISETTPLFIVLDDIQWADETSHNILGHLARHLYGYPILFLGTCRDTEVPKTPTHPLRALIAHMHRERSIETLDIEPLSREEIGTLVAHVSSLPETTVRNIQERAAGNPYFAEELARSTPPALPGTVKAALEQRIQQLSNACQQLLKNAAVLGGTFEFSLILAMESASTANSDELADEDAVLTLLEEALQSGVLTDEGSGTRILYHFWHPLLVDSLYESISGTRRARLHLRAADVLLRMNRGHEEQVAATLADHLIKGDAQPERIAHFSELAGHRAYSIFAYADAVRHYRHAVDYLLISTEQADGAQRAHLASLFEYIAECTSVQGNYAEARDLYERVLELHENLSTNTSNAADRSHEAQIQALLLIEIGLAWRYTGDKTRAWQCCERSEAILRQASVTGGPAWSRLSYLQSYLYRLDGRFEEALQAAQNSLVLLEEQISPSSHSKSSAGHTNTITQRILEGDPVNLGRVHRLIGTVAESVGQLSMALEHQGKALTLYELYDDRRQIGHVSCNIGYIHLKKAEYELARASLQRSLDIAERIGDIPLASLVTCNLAELDASVGNLTEAEERYRAILVRTESAEDRDREYVCRWNAGFAGVLQARGKLDEAATCVKHAWTIARAMGNIPCIGLTLVALGNLRIAQATAGISSTLNELAWTRERQRLLAHADADLRFALSLTHLEAETRTRGTLALARVAFLQNAREEARALISTVIEDAQRRELAEVEMQARALLTQVNG